jgi:hypothetical protein
VAIKKRIGGKWVSDPEATAPAKSRSKKSKVKDSESSGKKQEG